MKSFKNKHTYSLVHIKQKKLEYLFVFLLTFYEGEVCNVKLSEELKKIKNTSERLFKFPYKFSPIIGKIIGCPRVRISFLRVSLTFVGYPNETDMIPTVKW